MYHQWYCLVGEMLAVEAMDGKAQRDVGRVPAGTVDWRQVLSGGTLLQVHRPVHRPSSTIVEKRRKVEEARNRAMSIRNGDLRLFNSSNQVDEVDGFNQRNCTEGKDSVHNVSQGLPVGNNCSLELKESTSNDESEIIGESHRMYWWHKNGKRLVDEKRRLSQVDAGASLKKENKACSMPRGKSSGVSLTSKKEDSVERQVPSKDSCTDEGASWKTILSEKHRQENRRHHCGAAEQTGTLLSSSSPCEHSHLYPIIRETKRLSGFIRRYENKLETVCKSLLTSASSIEEENGALAAKELPLPEMLDFITEQDWYKAHSSDIKSVGLPRLVFTKKDSKHWNFEATRRCRTFNNENGDEIVEPDGKAYTVTSTGKSFLQMDGPMQADVSRFLAHLYPTRETGLTRNRMVAQWKEIARLSGDIQSHRVCNKIDELISFCIDSHMITCHRIVD